LIATAAATFFICHAGAQVEQLRVEHQKGFVGRDGGWAGTRGVEVGGDALGIGGAAGVGESPPTEGSFQVGDQPGGGQVDQR
jgi:hypothetical protein